MARFGAWSTLPSSLAVEALGRSGADFVGLDAQHGAHDFHDLVRAIQLLDLLEVESLVRLSELDLALIPRVLDFGASGVIVAMVERPETARLAVDFARYQPEGTRSYGGRRYGLSREPDDLREVRPAVWTMVETAQALEHLDEIAAVPGLAGFFVGPVDLALALGVKGPSARRLSAELAAGPPAGTDQPGEVHAWLEGCSRVVRVAHEHGLEAATFSIGGADARHWSAAGFDRVVVASDIALLRDALGRELGTAAGA
jgi:4-hydroxy-2-oxoheptanedioate aldolase